MQIGAFSSSAVARTLSDSERAIWWQRVTLEQPIQLEYQKRTAREIPIIMLDMQVAAPRRT